MKPIPEQHRYSLAASSPIRDNLSGSREKFAQGSLHCGHRLPSQKAVLADFVERLFSARFSATLILVARPLRTEDPNDTQLRFNDCVTPVEAGAFQQIRRKADGSADFAATASCGEQRSDCRRRLECSSFVLYSPLRSWRWRRLVNERRWAIPDRRCDRSPAFGVLKKRSYVPCWMNGTCSNNFRSRPRGSPS